MPPEMPELPEMRWYMLVDEQVVSTTDVLEWAEWKSQHGEVPHIGDTTFPAQPGRPEVRVSTVFLDVPHGLDRKHPELFETMVFGGPWDHRRWRYKTLAGARRGHDEIVGEVRSLLYGASTS